MNVGEVDVLIGVPTYNDAKTVGHVVQGIRAGLVKYFPRKRAVIINADGGSRDETQALVRAASISDVQRSANLEALRTLHCVSTQYPGPPSSGSALHTILSAADLLGASTCAIVAPDSNSLEPEWMQRLLTPVVNDGYDLVTPIYKRHKFDGMLIRNLVYPMTRAIYSKRLREPYPPEFAISGKFGSAVLNQDFWNTDIGRTGTEMYLTIAALTGNFRVVQSYLGEKARADHVRADLVMAMRQTVGVLYWSLEKNLPVWSANGASQPVPTIGPEAEVNLDPLRVNRKRLHEMFVHGVAELEPVLRNLLTAGTMAELQRLAVAPEDQFCFHDELWVRTVYEFAVSYHREVISRDHIVQALVPLYRGRAFCFLTENREVDAPRLEGNIEGLCQQFEQKKPYLLELWNAGK